MFLQMFLLKYLSLYPKFLLLTSIFFIFEIFLYPAKIFSDKKNLKNNGIILIKWLSYI